MKVGIISRPHRARGAATTSPGLEWRLELENSHCTLSYTVYCTEDIDLNIWDRIFKN